MLIALSVAFASSSPTPHITLHGEQPCNASDALQEAASSHQPARYLDAGTCNHTSAYPTGELIELFKATDHSLKVHSDDPQAVLAIWHGASTLRGNLVADMVRLALARSAWAALADHDDGPWLAEAQRLALAEPGPLPAHEGAAFRRELSTRDIDLTQRITYTLLSPLVDYTAAVATHALTEPRPSHALTAAQQGFVQQTLAYLPNPGVGILSVTRDGYEERMLLQLSVRSRYEAWHTASHE